MIEFDLKQFFSSLSTWQIKIKFEYGRIMFSGGDKQAREHFGKLLDENPEYEIAVILDLADRDDYVRECVEERAAIRAANRLPDDIESAVRCYVVHPLKSRDFEDLERLAW